MKKETVFEESAKSGEYDVEIPVSIYEEEDRRVVYFLPGFYHFVEKCDFDSQDDLMALSQTLKREMAQTLYCGDFEVKELYRYAMRKEDFVPCGISFCDCLDVRYEKNDTDGTCVCFYADGEKICEAGDNNTGDSSVAEIYCETEMKYRNRGYAAAAISLLLEKLFGQAGYEEIEYITESDNPASIKVALKSGFKYDGKMIHYLAYTEEEDGV